MSFSAFDHLMALADDGNDADSSFFGNDNNNNNNTEDNSPPTETQTGMCDTTIASESDISFHNDDDASSSMSFNSETLQDYGSTPSLPPGIMMSELMNMLNQHDSNSNSNNNNNNNDNQEGYDGERTIVSSDPSGGTITPPVPFPNIYAISPHPQMIISAEENDNNNNTIQCMATVCSETMSFQHNMATETDVSSSSSSSSDDDDDGEEEHVVQSVARSDQKRMLASHGHDPRTFVAVANQLLHHSPFDNNNDNMGDYDEYHDESNSMIWRKQGNNNNNNWYARFTEHDWDQFRTVAQMILSIMDPSPSPTTYMLPLPPSPPPQGLALLMMEQPYQHHHQHPKSHNNNTTGTSPTASYTNTTMSSSSSSSSSSYPSSSTCCAADMVPSNFICPLCLDILVGALTLDCGCHVPTVCSVCWENRSLMQQQMAEQLDYVWIDNNNNNNNDDDDGDNHDQQHHPYHHPRQQAAQDCPTCGKMVHSTVPCHALDVAILQIVKNLQQGNTNNNNNSHMGGWIGNYYSRLEAWRSVIVDRNMLRKDQETLRHDKWIARLIQEEENVLWNSNHNTSRRRRRQQVTNETAAAAAKMSMTKCGLLFLGQTTVALVAATLASMGLTAFAARR